MLDPFLLFLVGTVVLASILPCKGQGAVIFGWITNAAIFMLFFLHGAKLSREAVMAGVGHWRLHLLVAASTFVLFPAIGLVIGFLGNGRIDANMLKGVLFLCLLPSTVQSSIAFTSIGRGNVPAAVCSATLSNIAGIFITPLLVGLFMGTAAKGGGVNVHSIESIAMQLLLPFVLGHLSRPITNGFLTRHKSIVSKVDRGSILLVVYTAFSAAVVEGLWTKLSAGDIALVLVLDIVVLAVALTVTTLAARAFHFSKADEVSIVFCGSKKSLASGVPMAGALFPAAAVGPIIVPLMLFHQIQLMVCAVMARRYAARTDAEAGVG
ncbi:MAG: bile acid:sodium symporter family protein [Caulobacteraceae bacterium]